LRLCFFWYPSAMGWTDALLRISLSCGVLRFSFSRHFEGGWRCQQHAIITIYRSDEAAASLYRVLMMRLLDGRPRSNPDLVPPHRCSYSRIGVLVGCSALVKRPLSSRGFQARLELNLYRLSISRPSFVRNRGPTTAIRTCATSLPRRSKSAVASDAIRHMQVTDMEDSAKSGSKKRMLLRHRFGHRRFALPAPGHLEAPVPQTRTEICRYPVGLLSVVVCGSRCCRFFVSVRDSFVRTMRVMLG